MADPAALRSRAVLANLRNCDGPHVADLSCLLRSGVMNASVQAAAQASEAPLKDPSGATWIRFEPLPIGARCTLVPEGEPREDKPLVSHGSPTVSWRVRLSGGPSVRLSTGGELGQLVGTLSVTVGTLPHGARKHRDGKVAHGRLIWLQRSDDPVTSGPQSYLATVYVSTATYAAIARHALAGLLPRVRVFPARPGITAGWDPAGSVLNWDNQTQRALDIGWVDFSYEIEPVESQEPGPESRHEPPVFAPPPPDPRVEEIRSLVSRQVDELRSLRFGVQAALWVLVGLVAWLAVFK